MQKRSKGNSEALASAEVSVAQVANEAVDNRRPALAIHIALPHDIRSAMRQMPQSNMIKQESFESGSEQCSSKAIGAEHARKQPLNQANTSNNQQLLNNRNETAWRLFTVPTLISGARSLGVGLPLRM